MAGVKQQTECEIIKLVVPRKQLTQAVTSVSLSGHQHYLMAQQQLLTQRLAQLTSQVQINVDIQRALQADLQAIQAQLALVG
ncbi:hypothetical protein [Lactiplantibacillus daowaiensis]|uniref:Uncharacterized protein n=1 Tax=Lactiplantibacillus daowaiensis TaxID=2559918 RepID=A0ABW1S3A3_9LACO|nr:hypothetical protein [Lactiplantibacillus daowaiensis]